jgi:hypothetical protein
MGTKSAMADLAGAARLRTRAKCQPYLRTFRYGLTSLLGVKRRRRIRPTCSLIHFILVRVRRGRVRRKKRPGSKRRLGPLPEPPGGCCAPRCVCISVETPQVRAHFGRSIRLRPRVLHPSDFSCAKSHEPPSWTQHRLERADRMLLRRRPVSARLAPKPCQGRAIAGARIGRPSVVAFPGPHANGPGQGRGAHQPGHCSEQDVVSWPGSPNLRQRPTRTFRGDGPG